MEKSLNDYLGKIENYLRPVAPAERVDIIAEIKSEMLELQSQGQAPEAILARLGPPKELARAYLGDHIATDSAFSLRRLFELAGFYCLAGIGGLFVLPITVTLGLALIVCAMVSPLAGLVKFAGWLFGFDVPYVMFQIGGFTMPDLLVFPAAVVAGLLFFLAGRGLWRLSLRYVRAVGCTRRRLDS